MPPIKRRLASIDDERQSIKALLEENPDPTMTLRYNNRLFDYIKDEDDFKLLINAKAVLPSSSSNKSPFKWLKHIHSLESICIAIENGIETSQISKNIYKLYLDIDEKNDNTSVSCSNIYDKCKTSNSSSNIDNNSTNSRSNINKKYLEYKNITYTLLESKATPDIILRCPLLLDDQSIKLLLQYKADINTLDTSQSTPLLHKIIKNTNLELLTLILCESSPITGTGTETACNINIQDCNGMSPLHIAVGLTDTIDTNIDHIIDNTINNNTLDDYTINNNNNNNNNTTNNNNTPDDDNTHNINTMGMNSNIKFKIIQLLLKYKADTNSLDNDDNTPLLLGLSNPCITRLLLDHSANPLQCNKSGEYPLHKVGKYPNTLSILLHNTNIANNIDTAIIQANHMGQPPLFYALQSEKSVELLINAKANVNQIIEYKNSNDIITSSTLLHRAIIYPETLKLLINGKANVNIIDSKGFTAAWSARYTYDSLLLILQESSKNEHTKYNQFMRNYKSNHKNANNNNNTIYDIQLDSDIQLDFDYNNNTYTPLYEYSKDIFLLHKIINYYDICSIIIPILLNINCIDQDTRNKRLLELAPCNLNSLWMLLDYGANPHICVNLTNLRPLNMALTLIDDFSGVVNHLGTRCNVVEREQFERDLDMMDNDNIFEMIY